VRPGTVDDYLRDGCGRCERFRTPGCKVHRFAATLVALRALARAAGLTEEVKWGAPCYTLDGRNVAMVSALDGGCVLSFFQGALLEGDGGALELPGPNSRVARVLRFREVDEVEARRPLVEAMLAQAAALARSGAKVAPAPDPGPLPDALEALLAADPALRRAFEALTPGRRRSHALHVAAAKQPGTRARRAAGCAPLIAAGRGADGR
jgi:uncharacterized protein YdeI (YjbR/CyaY-like superfamily)